MTPIRIQRKRVKGWKMPEGAIYVGRPTRWGNPYEVTKAISASVCVRLFREMWEEFIANETEALPRLRRNLGGRDLVCWCPLHQPCHADVLLELANK